MYDIQPRHPRVILFILSAATALMPLSIDMYLPAFPRIAGDLHTPISMVEFSLTSFFIGIAIGQLFYGLIADRFGRKISFYIGLSLAAVTSLTCALMPEIHLLIGFRFLQALGICSGVVTSRAVVRDMFDHREAAGYFSMLMAIMGVAPVVAPSVGGYMAHYLGWHSIFLVTAFVSVCCLIAVAWFLPETHGADPSVQFSRSLHLYFDILCDFSFLRLVLAGGFALGGLFAYITGSPYVLIDYFKLPAEQYGLLFGANAFGLIACSQLNRKLLQNFRFEEVLNAGYGLILVAGLTMALCGLLQSGFIAFAGALFFYVTLVGMVSPNSMAGALAEQGRRAGAASALAGSLQFAIAFAVSAMIGSIKAQSPMPLCLMMGFCACLSFGVAQFIKTAGPEDIQQ